ncbi:MAG TPA: phosphotransferase [Nocardioides sp.]|uniref:phosphotransferase n=1 Tax=Nocardioides sp. TaxID=35761 RepID=UPI002F424373
MTLVVCAAILRHGTLLAARRTTPAAAAGGWELPGGKVGPDEPADVAVVREIGEELGCRVRVEGWLDGEQTIDATHVLRVAQCTLVDGEPRADTDHDELRWLTPEQLGEVAWLEADRAFLDELRELLLDGEELPGGNVGGAVRIGITVRRPTGPWTPAVHALLDHLAAAGLRAVPRVHGIDDRGREVLDYLSGEVVDVDTELVSDPRLADLGRWARELHEAQRGFAHPGPWRFESTRPHALVMHNDLAPYNVAFEGDRVSGVFDWDVAAPGPVLFELAQIAWTCVPLFRPVPDEVAARRLRVLATAYDGPTAAEILTGVPARVQSVIDGLRAAMESGDRTLDRLAAEGEPDRTAGHLRDFLTRRPALAAALARS